MTARARVVAVLTALSALTIGLAPRAHAGGALSDLTGSWTGKIKCKGFFDGAKDSFTLFPTMLVTTDGLNVAMRLTYTGGTVEDYSGRMNPDLKKPLQKAELAIVACGTNDQVGDAAPVDPRFDEVGRMATSVKGLPDFKGSFRGTSIFSDYGTPAAADTCKWKFKRTDTTDPNLPLFCNHTMLTLPPASN